MAVQNRDTNTDMLLTRTYEDGSVSEYLVPAGGTYFFHTSVSGDHKLPNPQSYVKKVYRNFSGELIVYNAFGFVYRDQGAMASYTMLQGNPSSYWMEPEQDRIIRLATSRFYKNLRQSELNLSISIGEAAQTKKMLEDATAKVESIARRARRKALRSLWRGVPWHKAISSAWLSYIYGWKPALNDIFGLVNHSRVKANRFPVESTAKGGVNHRFVTQPSGPSGITLAGNVDQSTKVRISVIAAVSNSYLLEYSRIASLNPLGLAWEFAPLSFVADWFTGLGSYLDQLEQSYGNGLTFIRGYQTVVSRDVYRTVAEPQTFGTLGGARYTIPTAWIGRGVLTQKRRFVLTDFPEASPPQLDINLGSQRLISAAALITQLFRPPKGLFTKGSGYTE